MLEICKRHASTTSGQVKLGVCVSVMFIVAMVFGLLVVAKPYAVYATGEKVSEPWVVKVDQKEVVVVESREAGEDVLTGLRTKYATGVIDQQTADINENITVEKYQFNDPSTHPVVMNTPEAVAYVVDMNKQNKDIIRVGTKEVVKADESVPFATEEVETDDLEKGSTTVQTEGVDGLSSVVYEVEMVNGKEAKRTKLSSKEVKAPVTQVVLIGTKEPAPVVRSTSSSGGSRASSTQSVSRPSYSATGNAVVDYGLQFLGTPYVYGGTSLTGGIDCSGFTQAVYAKFGVSLPHSSAAQRSSGVGVSYSQAQPGDLICYSGHVALYMGGGKVVHANGYGRGVQVSDATYNTILTVRRVL